MTDEHNTPDQARTSELGTAETPSQPKPAKQRVQVDFKDDLDYKYRDVLNIFVGRGDVVFELGNIHRSLPDQATISDRIVVSLATAYDFHARLGQALKEAQGALQREIQKPG